MEGGVPPPLATPTTAAEAAALEAKHVNAVYNRIGDHFSDTRYKPWPVVDAFLRWVGAGAVPLFPAVTLLTPPHPHIPPRTPAEWQGHAGRIPGL